MSRSPRVAELSSRLRSRRSMLDHGSTERQITELVRSGALHVVRRGWYLDAAEWKALWPEGRHLAHVIAVARDGEGRGVMSHTSAAVLLGLPLYRVRPERVHMTFAVPDRISSGPDVFRHVAPLTGGDTAVIGGIRCMSLARTVFDVSRTLGREAAVSAADAAERSMAVRGREWDADCAASWRGALSAIVDGAGAARGIRQARWVAGFADGRAELPAESVSRLQLSRLGFQRPRLQVPVPAPEGGRYWIDIGMDDVDVWAEVDGKGKYLDEELRDGRSLEEVLYREKRREDWIRGTTGRRVIRWPEEDCRTPEALARRLRAFGIRIPA